MKEMLHFTSRKAFEENSKLIHCITNPISINDCANAILCLGAQPIMAEHPAEAAEITAGADALALNIGNITDARMEAIPLSLSEANLKNIPSILDMVGVGCSTLRQKFIHELLQKNKPTVLKGNLSEWMVFLGQENHVRGVDVSAADQKRSLDDILPPLCAYVRQNKVIALISGKTDIVTDGNRAFAIHNGCSLMGRLTGTGCMMNVVTAAFLAIEPPLEATVHAAAFYGAAGEKAAENAKLPGSFHVALMNALASLSDEEFEKYQKIEELEITL